MKPTLSSLVASQAVASDGEVGIMTTLVFQCIYTKKIRPISQIPQCIRQISHNAPFCNRNVHTCAHFCHKMVHCGLWDQCTVGWVHYPVLSQCVTPWQTEIFVALLWRHNANPLKCPQGLLNSIAVSKPYNCWPTVYDTLPVCNPTCLVLSVVWCKSCGYHRVRNNT